MRNAASSRRPLALFFALACGISWLLWAPLWLPAFGITGLPIVPFHHALGACGPVAAALIVAFTQRGIAGPVELLRRAVMWRGQLRWIAIALFVPYLLLALVIVCLPRFGGETTSLNEFGMSREFPQFSALGFLAYNIVSFGFGEEVGWRGFALPRLQERHSAFVATLVLSTGWALWHIPLFLYRPGYTEMNAAGIAGWFFSLLTGAVLLTWLYNASQGSLLVVAIFHATVDVAFTSTGSTSPVVNALGALITLWGLGVLFTARRQFWKHGNGDERPISVTESF